MKRTVAVIGIICAILLFFFRSYFFGNKLLFSSNLLVAFFSPWNTVQYPGWVNIPFKALSSDTLFYFYPVKTLLREAVSQHVLPLWTPYTFAGGPLFGDGQSAFMYPLTYLYLLPSLPDAFSVMVVLVPALTMLFTYGMLRHFKLSPLASLFGAVAFAFSGFMSVWMEENAAVAQSAIWLPLLVWMVDLLVTKPRRRWFVAASLVTAVMMASGFLQICLYQLSFVTIYAFFRNRKNFWLFILSTLTGLLLIAPYLTTTWEAYMLSPRNTAAAPEIRSVFLVQWSHIISLFNPDFLGNPGTYNYFGAGSYYDKALFIGVVPLVFVVIGLFGKKSRAEKFFWWTAAVTLFLGISSPVTQWLFSLPIPIVSSMIPSRIFYLTTFVLSVIAAVQFNKKTKLHIKPALITYLLLIIVLGVFLLSYVAELTHPWAKPIREFIVSSVKVSPAFPMVFIRNIAISAVLTAGTFLLLKYRKLLFIVAVCSAWYFTNKSLYTGERQFVYPSVPVISALQKIAGINRIGFVGEKSRVPAASNVVYGLYSPEGINPVYPLRYGQLVRSALNGGFLTEDISRIYVKNDLERAYIDGTATAHRLTRLRSLLGIKYIVDTNKTDWYARVFPDDTVVWKDTIFRIWENPDSLPRAFIATNTVMEKNPQKILDAVYRSDLRTTAIVETPVQAAPGTNSVMIDSYRMNDITMHYSSTSNGLLVISDNWAPGWHAFVDGKQTPVFRTDFTLRGVPVPAGNHAVYMYYWPDSLTRGIYLMGGGIILLLTVVSLMRGNGTFSTSFRSRTSTGRSGRAYPQG